MSTGVYGAYPGPESVQMVKLKNYSKRPQLCVCPSLKERTLKIQREQQKISVLAGKAQEYLRMIKTNLGNPGFESQISGWITVLDVWRRIWETQEEQSPQPVKTERKPSQ